MRIGDGLPGSVAANIGALNSLNASSTLSVYKLEKHLDDYRKGRGNLSLDSASQLKQEEAEIISKLPLTNPKALSTVGAYSTGFSYEQRARFTQGVSGLVRSLDLIV